MNKIKQNLEQIKKYLEEFLSGFAKKDPNLKNDWDTKFPDIGPGAGDEGFNEDLALKREEYERILPVEHTLEEKLAKVNDALEKVEKGSYGVCEKCGEKISEERLKAIPETKTCRNCKE